MRALAALLGMESLRLLRTREVQVYLLLPTILVLPVVLTLTSVALTVFPPRPIVAMAPPPAGLPAELRGRAGPRNLRTDEPAAAFSRGDTRVAITGWRELPSDPTDPTGGTHWVMDVLDEPAADPRDRDLVHRSLTRAADRWLADEVALAGGDPIADLAPLSVSWHPVTADGGFRYSMEIARVPFAAVGFLLMALGSISIPGLSVLDRESGLMETLRARPSTARYGLLARITALAGLQLLIVGLGSLNLAAIRHRVWSDLVFDVGPRFAALVLFQTALLVVAGEAARTTQSATAAGSLALWVQASLLSVGVLRPLPWVPAGGLIDPNSPTDAATAIAVTVAAAALLVAVAERLQAHRLATG